jgi:two-component system response regulator PilR (NtrC family)
MARILLVEDDADVRELFESSLLDAGYEVDAVEALGDGLELLEGIVYDFVLTDGRLPDGTGVELADRAAIKGVPAVIVTGYAFMFRDLMGASTQYKVVLKPIRPSEILHIIEQALAER